MKKNLFLAALGLTLTYGQAALADDNHAFCANEKVKVEVELNKFETSNKPKSIVRVYLNDGTVRVHLGTASEAFGETTVTLDNGAGEMWLESKVDAHLKLTQASLDVHFQKQCL